MSIPNGHWWKMSYISDANNFLSRKALIPIKRRKVKTKGWKWLFNSREYHDRLFYLNERNVAKGYTKFPGVYYDESF